MATVYDFLNPDSTEVEEQRIIRAAGTTGDVLTLQANGTVSPAPGGGSQPGTLHSADFLFTERATRGTGYAITAVSVNDGTFTIAGNHASVFLPCDWFNVLGSTGNDGLFGVASVVFAGGSTTITTGDPISDATVDGTIYPSQYRSSLALPAGSVIDTVRFFPLATWAADTAYVFVFESELDVDLVNGTNLTAVGGGGGLTSAYDPLAITDTSVSSAAGANHGSAREAYADGTASADVHLVTTSTVAQMVAASSQGIGYLVPEDYTLTITVATSIAAPPVVPTGILRVRFIYWMPVTPTAATFS